MAIEVVCEGCNKNFRVKDDMAGKRGKCPACGGVISVPSGSKLPTADLPILPPIEAPTHSIVTEAQADSVQISNGARLQTVDTLVTSIDSSNASSVSQTPLSPEGIARPPEQTMRRVATVLNQVKLAMLVSVAIAATACILQAIFWFTSQSIWIPELMRLSKKPPYPKGYLQVLGFIALAQLLAIVVGIYSCWLVRRLKKNSLRHALQLLDYKPRYLPTLIPVLTGWLSLYLCGVTMTRDHNVAIRSLNTRTKMHEIGVAFRNFQQENKRLPEHATADSKGAPRLSWRVQVLPHLSEIALYNQFRLDEPWDSPSNKNLIARMPKVYASPNSRVANEGRTRFLVPVGPTLSFSPTPGESRNSFNDGAGGLLGASIGLVEVDDDHAVIWTKPDDLIVDLKNPRSRIGTPSPRGFLISFSGGGSFFVPKAVDNETLATLFIPGGARNSEDGSNNKFFSYLDKYER